MNAKNGLSIVSVVCNEERALSYQLPLIRELTTDLTIVIFVVTGRIMFYL
jgi:hypothetical protein